MKRSQVQLKLLMPQCLTSRDAIECICGVRIQRSERVAAEPDTSGNKRVEKTGLCRRPGRQAAIHGVHGRAVERSREMLAKKAMK
eukprot:7383592-Alexandrium_andersonii.AAC.1